MTRVLGIGLWAAAQCLAACGESATGTRDLGASSAPETTAEVSPETTIASDTPAVDSPATTATETTAADTRPEDTRPEDTGPTETGPTTAPDIADTTVPEDTAPAPLASCPVPSMSDLYPGPLPPFPYGDWPPADACLRQVHDVAIVLGCPSSGDGSASACQTGRAIMADQLYEAGWVSNFIVSGGAIHNQWSESDALASQLADRGIPAANIYKEPLAAHTDENVYYSTRIMQDHGWTSAFIISEDPGHLMMTALCDTNCCVDLGRMTLVAFPIAGEQTIKVGHYVLSPPGAANAADECTHVAGMAMCFNQATRKACKANFQLGPP